MSPTTIPSQVLKQLPIFNGMSHEERDKLIQIGNVLAFSKGEELMTQGNKGQNFCVLLEGTCEIVRKTDMNNGSPAIVLDKIDQPAHFGEMSFFHEAPHSASVIATSDVKLLRFKREDYNKLIEQGELAAYKLALNAVDVMAYRLRRMDQWVTKLIGDKSNKLEVSEWTRFRHKIFS